MPGLNPGEHQRAEGALPTPPPRPSMPSGPAGIVPHAGGWWHGRPKDWSVKPGSRDYALQQRVIAAVSPRDPRHARMPCCGEPGITGHPVFCRHPACRVCLAVERGAQKRRARDRFASLDRSLLRFPTTLLGATNDLSDAVPMFATFKDNYAAALRRHRRRDARWDGVSMMAVMEVAMHRDNEVHRLSLGMQRTLTEMNAPVGTFGAAVWLVHLHGLVHLAEVPEAEFRQVLTSILPGHRAVHLEPIFTHGTVAEQVTNIMGYAHKPALLQRDPMTNRGWAPFDDEELAEFVAWCGSPDGRFPKRRFHFGATRAWKARMAEAKVAADHAAGEQPVPPDHRQDHPLAENPCPIRTAPARRVAAGPRLFIPVVREGGVIPAAMMVGEGFGPIRLPDRARPRRGAFRADVPRRVPQTRGLEKKKPLTHWISGKSNREASRLGD
jgi:hypothetical protein